RQVEGNARAQGRLVEPDGNEHFGAGRTQHFEGKVGSWLTWSRRSVESRRSVGRRPWVSLRVRHGITRVRRGRGVGTGGQAAVRAAAAEGALGWLATASRKRSRQDR